MKVSWNSKDVEGTWYPLYRQEVLKCSRCSARKDCRQPVPGEGNINADLVFIGRNPGSTEDQTGRPFVGKAGDIFDRLLMEYEWERPQIFVTNLYLCYTSGNRMPSLAEVKACVPKFLMWSLEEIKPKVVVTFGASTNYYMNGIKKVSEVHGKLFWHNKGFWVVPSIHPAAVAYRRDKWKELVKITKVIDEALKR